MWLGFKISKCYAFFMTCHAVDLTRERDGGRKRQERERRGQFIWRETCWLTFFDRLTNLMTYDRVISFLWFPPPLSDL